ncbi:MAG: 2-hydroxyacyl-CoA dehydratase family protein [Desulfobacterales bacterium]|jgi:benzoyl-CoA reductase subunit C
MLEKFRDWVENRHERVKQWKADNSKKSFGYLCCVAPEELIYAAAMLPMKVTGSSDPIEVADKHVVHYACPYARSILDLAGRGVYDYLDGVLVCNTCDILSRCGYYWRMLAPREKSTVLGVETTPYVLYINHPEKISGRGVHDYLKAEYRICKQQLEREQRCIITDEKLSETIEVYNEHYDLMEQLHAFRRKNTAVVSGSEAFEVEFSSLLMPKDEHNRLMKSYLDELSQRQPPSDEPVRLYLSGGGVDQFTYQIYSIIEECGGQVVAEDIGAGKSYFHRKIDTDKPPLDAIVDHRLDVHCPHTMSADYYPHKNDERFGFIQKTLEGHKLDGAVFFVPLYCECRNTEYPRLKENFKDIYNVPTLYLDSDYTQGGLDETSAKIEAFVEMIRG